MLFTTVPFWAAFTAFLTVYALLRKTAKGIMMAYVTAASLCFFYLCNGWLMLLLPATALVSWSLTDLMLRQEGWQRKGLLWLVVLLDLLPLCFFKYAHPAIELLGGILHSGFSLHQLALPVGISFYTFQAISHAVDVYRRRFTLRVSLLEYLFFLTFFPLLLAGPITRAGTFIPQVRCLHHTDGRLLWFGLWLVIMGIVKKAVFADYLAQYNDWIFTSPEAYSGFECLMGIVGYTMQIYLDFSGYSDLSIGLAAMMGIRLRDNFSFPYRSRSLTEFWHRWHISLSTWFRDYVYIPLGGNRHGTFVTCLNLLVTMLLAGLWHGSTMMFVIWGLLHGLGLVLHKLWRSLGITLPSWLAAPLTLLYVAFCWIFFHSPDLSTAHTIILRTFTVLDFSYALPFLQVRSLWCGLLLGSILLLFVGRRLYDRTAAWFVTSPWFVKLLFFSAAVQLAILLRTSEIQPFLYFGF